MLGDMGRGLCLIASLQVSASEATGSLGLEEAEGEDGFNEDSVPGILLGKGAEVWTATDEAAKLAELKVLKRMLFAECPEGCRGKARELWGLACKVFITQVELDKGGIGGASLLNTKFSIRLCEGAKPIREPPRRLPVSAEEIVLQQLRLLQAAGVIEPSESPWSSPVCVVKQKDKLRLCIDYRRLNQLTVKDSYPLPRVDMLVERLANQGRLYAVMDAACGFWQLEVEPASRPLTAFSVPGFGHFQWTRMPFGLANAPAAYQRCMDGAFASVECGACLYIDDVGVGADKWLQLCERLTAIFRRALFLNLRFKAKKTQWFVEKATYLGFQLQDGAVRPCPSKVEALLKIEAPRNAKEAKSFLGAVAYYRQHLPGLSGAAEAMTRLLKQGAKWCWGGEQQQAFEALRAALVASARFLPVPLPSSILQVETDASLVAMAGVLRVKSPGEDEYHDAAYFSAKFNPAQTRYSVTERELLAVIKAFHHWRHFLFGASTRFQLVTDHAALRFLFSASMDSDRLHRWSMALQQYAPFEVEHRPGKEMIMSDFLSRYGIEKRLPTFLLKKKLISELLLEGSQLRQALGEVLSEVSKGDNKGELQRKLRLKILQEASDAETVVRVVRTERCIAAVDDGVAESKKENELEGAPRIIPSASDVAVAASAAVCVQSLQLSAVQVEAMLTALHEDYGHPGVGRLIYLLDSLGLDWCSRAKDVHEFVSSCVRCAQRKVGVLRRVAYQPSHIGGDGALAFNDLVCIDAFDVGVKSSKGYNEIVTIVDVFTRTVALYAVESETTEVLVECVLKWVSVYGFPKALRSDSGKGVTGKLMKQFARTNNIDLQPSLPYAQFGNGVVERFHRQLTEWLALYVASEMSGWCNWLTVFEGWANTHLHSRNGVSPAVRNPRLNVDGIPDGGDAYAGAVKLLKRLVPRFRPEPRESAPRSGTGLVKLKGVEGVEPVAGHYVMVQDQLEQRKKLAARKFQPRFRGPYAIIGVKSYSLVLDKEGTPFEVHRKFCYDASNLGEVAFRRYQAHLNRLLRRPLGEEIEVGLHYLIDPVEDANLVRTYRLVRLEKKRSVAVLSSYGLVGAQSMQREQWKGAAAQRTIFFSSRKSRHFQFRPEIKVKVENLRTSGVEVYENLVDAEVMGAIRLYYSNAQAGVLGCRIEDRI